MDTTVKLDASHFKAAAERARALGKTTQQYLECLIDTDARTFDEILEPVRKGFESVPDDELDALFERAKTAARLPDQAAG